MHTHKKKNKHTYTNAHKMRMCSNFPLYTHTRIQRTAALLQTIKINKWTILTAEWMSLILIGQWILSKPVTWHPAHTKLENCCFPRKLHVRRSWHFTSQHAVLYTEGSWPLWTPLKLFPQRSRLTWDIASVASWEGSLSCSTVEAAAEKNSLKFKRQKVDQYTHVQTFFTTFLKNVSGVLGGC